MQSESGITTSQVKRPILGILSFIFGLLAIFSFIMMTVVTLLPNFNPPGWIRIATIGPLPLVLVASIVLGAIALLRRSGKIWAVAGLVASALVIVAFAVLIKMMG